MTWRQATPTHEVEEALAQVERALAATRFEDLEEFATTLEAAQDALLSAPAGGISEDALRRLRDRAARLAPLLMAARKGLEDAHRALSRGPGFSSYDANGRSGPLALSRSRFERRR